MRAQLQPDVEQVVDPRRRMEFDRGLLHVQVAVEPLHRLLVRQRQRAPVVGHRGVEIHQIVRVEDDLLHVHFGPAHAQAVEKTEVLSHGCHWHRVSCAARQSGCASAAAASPVRCAGLRQRAAHLDEFVRHAAVDLQLDRHACGAQLVGVCTPSSTSGSNSARPIQAGATPSTSSARSAARSASRRGPPALRRYWPKNQSIVDAPAPGRCA